MPVYAIPFRFILFRFFCSFMHSLIHSCIQSCKHILHLFIPSSIHLSMSFPYTNTWPRCVTNIFEVSLFCIYYSDTSAHSAGPRSKMVFLRTFGQDSSVRYEFGVFEIRFGHFRVRILFERYIWTVGKLRYDVICLLAVSNLVSELMLVGKIPKTKQQISKILFCACSPLFLWLLDAP